MQIRTLENYCNRKENSLQFTYGCSELPNANGYSSESPRPLTRFLTPAVARPKTRLRDNEAQLLQLEP
jgi:hypothetical protein